MSHLAPGEPIFPLRGQDPDGAATIRWWAARKADAGAPAEVVEPALAMADVFEAWPHKKPTDGDPDLSDAERAQLAYQLARRGRREEADASCSFCTATLVETDHLVRGPGEVAICGGCVEHCAEIFANRGAAVAARVQAEGRSL